MGRLRIMGREGDLQLEWRRDDVDSLLEAAHEVEQCARVIWPSALRGRTWTRVRSSAPLILTRSKSYWYRRCVAVESCRGWTDTFWPRQLLDIAPSTCCSSFSRPSRGVTIAAMACSS